MSKHEKAPKFPLGLFVIWLLNPPDDYRISVPK